MLELAASKAADLTAFDHAGTARSKYSSVRERVRVKAEEQRAKMEEPTAIRLRDKLSFMLGVVGCFVIEACVLQAPQLYPYLSRVKLRLPWQRPSSAPAPPQGAPGGSGQLGTPRKRPTHWAPSHCLGCSS